MSSGEKPLNPPTQAGEAEAGDGKGGGHVQANAARSVVCVVTNETNMDLSRNSESLAHGIWSTNMYPPEIIPAGTTAQFEAESQGFMTGCEGQVNYEVDGATTVTFYFDNPYIGDNGYKTWMDGPDSDSYNTQYSGGSGNNATVTYRIKQN
ncbi:uncharacterized protein B0T15DRAFT_78165 [Chaetomium strumarium]|uniref:Crystal protein ET79 n=1 Tax=Chaetomium strumarium TaxID=1170767 RepID=A0AAJ0H462_9PEZI|nr:hypothetical protein B0T15DRAFT_78165 [Chaetomium strumarium]